MSNPSKPLLVALVGSRFAAASPTCDDAIDLDFKPADGAPGITRLLSDYSRSRSDEDRDKLPLREGKSLTLFEVQALSAKQLRRAESIVGNVDRTHFVFKCVCLLVKMPDGAKDLTTTIPSDRVCANDEWIDDVIFPTFGQDAIDEVAHVALERAKAGARAKLPFSLPPGLMLAR